MQIDEEEKIPKDHKFEVQAVTKQTLGVFSQIGNVWSAYLLVPKSLNIQTNFRRLR